MSPVTLVVLTAAWTLGLLLLGVGDVPVYLAPLLLILIPLLTGRYPGDEALVRAARRLSRRGRRARPAPEPRPRRSPRTGLLPRGGRLVGAALAGRAPPAPPSCPA